MPGWGTGRSPWGAAGRGRGAAHSPQVTHPMPGALKELTLATGGGAGSCTEENGQRGQRGHPGHRTGQGWGSRPAPGATAPPNTKLGWAGLPSHSHGRLGSSQPRAAEPSAIPATRVPQCPTISHSVPQCPTVPHNVPMQTRWLQPSTKPGKTKPLLFWQSLPVPPDPAALAPCPRGWDSGGMDGARGWQHGRGDGL